MKNTQEKKAYDKQWHIDNREQRLKYMKKYYRKNKHKKVRKK